MTILLNVSTLAMREIARGVCRAHGVGQVIDVAEKLEGLLRNHFRDHSSRLAGALRGANNRGWQTLEIALTGDSFWDRCKGMLKSGDEKKFRQELETYLHSLQLPEDNPLRFRRFCLSELRAGAKTRPSRRRRD